MDGYKLARITPVWELRLNKYQRDHLLAVLDAAEDTGDWYQEVRQILAGLPTTQNHYWER